MLSLPDKYVLTQGLAKNPHCLYKFCTKTVIKKTQRSPLETLVETFKTKTPSHFYNPKHHLKKTKKNLPKPKTNLTLTLPHPHREETTVRGLKKDISEIQIGRAHV